MAAQKDVETRLLFLERTPKYDAEKPYTLQYEPEGDLARTNCDRVEVPGILIKDIRGKESHFKKNKNGFEVLHLDSEMKHEDFYDDARVESIYYSELRELLKRQFNAKRVEILEHNVRKRHTAFPVATGKDYEYQQPTSVVHVASALEISRRVFGVELASTARIETVNMWKPLRGPLMDWPLAVCDTNSVNPKADLIDCDVVAREGYAENQQVFYNQEFQWHYLSNQMPSELMVFRQADTDSRFNIGVPHAAFFNPLAKPDEVPRESVETRAFIMY